MIFVERNTDQLKAENRSLKSDNETIRRKNQQLEIDLMNAKGNAKGSSSVQANLKKCPASREDMMPCELYGEEVDVSEKGIWFDKGELVEVLNKANKADFGVVKRLFKQESFKEKLREKREEALKIKGEYDKAVNQIETALEALERAERTNDPSLPTIKAQFIAACTKEATLFKSAKLNITPGSPDYNEFEGFNAADESEAIKCCPGNRKSMAKIFIHGITLDVSENGIWFDEGELVDLLNKIKAGTPGIAGYFTSYKSHIAKILDGVKAKSEIAAKLATVFDEYRIENRRNKQMAALKLREYKDLLRQMRMPTDLSE